MTTASLAQGARLNDQQFDTLVELIQEQPTMLKDVVIQPLDNHTGKVESLEYPDRVAFKATEGVAPTADQRKALTGSKVELITQEIQAETYVTLDTAETSLLRKAGANALYAYATRKLAEKFALNIQELIVLGDTLSADDYLTTINGILKQAVTNVVDFSSENNGAGANINDRVFYAGLMALPKRFRSNKPNLRYYCNDNLITSFNANRAGRTDSLGVTVSVDGTDITKYQGIRFYDVSHFPDDTYILTSRRNITVGIARDVTSYMYPDPSARSTIFGMTMRVDVKYGEEVGVAKVIGLNPFGSTTVA
jgi:hypothetical protein